MSNPIPDSADDVIRAIEEAFAGVAPGAISLHQAEALDDYATKEEQAAARQRDTETDWREIPDGAIAECSCALSYFDPPGWRFHLPAYMRWSVRHLREEQGMIVDHTIFSLTPTDDRRLVAYKEERFNTLNEAQARAVHRFLWFMLANEDWCDSGAVADALDRRWEVVSGGTG